MTVALIVGGAETGVAELGMAHRLCAGRHTVSFLVNDRIGYCGEKNAYGVTLHPSLLAGWLAARELHGLPALRATWSWYSAPQIDRVTEDLWQGSSGLFAVKIALVEFAIRKIVLCGVPMSGAVRHFIRPQQRFWHGARHFRRAWEEHKDAFAPFVRSFSGFTAELLGRPDAEFLGA